MIKKNLDLMKYLKYFEGKKWTSGRADLTKYNNFLLKVVTKAQDIYKNLLPSFEGDVIKDLHDQEPIVVNIYKKIIEICNSYYYSPIEDLDKKNINKIFPVIKPELDELLTKYSFELFSYNMFVVYTNRYKNVLPPQSDYYLSDSGADTEIDRDPKKMRKTTDIFGKLENVIYQEWTSVISDKNPDNITDADILNIVSKMDAIIVHFETTEEGKEAKEKVERNKSEEVEQYAMKNLPTSIKRMHLDKAPSGHVWGKTVLENPLAELPAKHWYPPKI